MNRSCIQRPVHPCRSAASDPSDHLSVHIPSVGLHPGTRKNCFRVSCQVTWVNQVSLTFTRMGLWCPMILYKVIGLTLQASLLRDLFYNNCIFISLSTPRLTFVQQDENYEGLCTWYLLQVSKPDGVAVPPVQPGYCCCHFCDPTVQLLSLGSSQNRQPLTSSSCAPSSCSYLVCCCRCRWLITTLLLSVLDIILNCCRAQYVLCKIVNWREKKIKELDAKLNFFKIFTPF